MKALQFSFCVLFGIALPMRAAVVSDFMSQADASGEGVIISWSATNATLEAASELEGPWVAVPGALSPYLIPTQQELDYQFFRLNFGQNSNLPPVANGDSYTTTHDQPLSVPGPGVLTNDTSPGGLALTAVLVGGPANGTLDFNPDGSFLYTPNPGFVGSDFFTYEASNDEGASAPATVSISVINHPPVAVNDSYGVQQNQSLYVDVPGVLANDSDPDGDAITPNLNVGPANGVLSLNTDGSFTYTPNPGYSGPDSFTYYDNDGLTNGNIATVTLNVHATNSPPFASGQSYTTAQDTLLSVPAPGLLGGASDSDGDPLSVMVVTGPTNGTVVSFSEDGSFEYQPAGGFVGFDSFTFQVNDGLTNSPIATVNITVTNSQPLAAAYTFYVHLGAVLNVPASGVLLNDTDPDGDGLVAALVSGPSHGELGLNSDGSFSYTNTDLSFQGADTFTYQAADSFGTSTSLPGVVTIVITNRPPIAVNDFYGAHANMTLNVLAPGVLGNDTDPDGDSLTAVGATTPLHGSVTLNPDGSFSYTPTGGYSGPDSFTYMASDGFADSAPATVTLNVHLTNAVPVSGPTEYTMRPNETLFATNDTVLASDLDADGDPLTAVLVTSPSNGTLIFTNNGTFIYTPVSNFVGSDVFTYQPQDGLVSGAVTQVTIEVVNSAPDAVADNYEVHFNGNLSVGAPGVLENDTDADDDELTAILVTGTTNGTLELNADGSFDYIPSTNFVGTDSFTYMADDGYTTSIPTIVTINVIDAAPVAQVAIYSVITNGTLSVSSPGLIQNVLDDDGDPLTVALVSTTTNGTLSVNSDGSFNYTPNPGFIGTDTFTYTGSDGGLTSPPGTITIEVTANGQPTVVAQPAITSSIILSQETFDNVYQTPNLIGLVGFVPTGRAVYSDWVKQGQVAERGLPPVAQLEPGYWSYSWKWPTFNGVVGPNLSAVAANAGAGSPGRTAQFGYPYIYAQGNTLAARARLKFVNQVAGIQINLSGDVYWGAPLAQVANAIYLNVPGSVYVPLPGLVSARLTAPGPLRPNGAFLCSGETPFMLASAAFPKTVGFMPMTIVWHYNSSADIVPIERVCGISRHTIYLTFAQTANLRNYWTVVDDGCRAAGNAALPAGNGNQMAFINKIYNTEFATQKATRVDNAPLGYYATQLQSANSALGWTATGPGWNASQQFTLPGLLAKGSGLNSAWAELFLEVLQAQGLKNAAGEPVGSLRRAVPAAPEGALLKGTLAPLAGNGPSKVFSIPQVAAPGLIYPSFGKGPGMPAVPGNPWRFKFDNRSDVIPVPSTLVGQNGNTAAPIPNGAGPAAAAPAPSGPPNWWYLSYLVNAGTTYYDPAYGLSYAGISDMQTKWLGGTGAAATGGAFRWLNWNPTRFGVLLPEFNVRKVRAGAGFISFVSLTFTTQPGNVGVNAANNVVVTAKQRVLNAAGNEVDNNLNGVTIRLAYENNAGRASAINLVSTTGANGQATFNARINRAGNGYQLVAWVIMTDRNQALQPASFAAVVSSLFNVGP